MMKLRTIKYCFAVLLILCIFLPLSKCSKKDLVEDDPEKEGAYRVVSTRYSYFIPVKEITVQDPFSFLSIIPFIWPIPIWLIQRRLTSKCVVAGVVVFKAMEMLLLCTSTYYIVLWSIFFGEIQIGGYLALLCLSIIWLVLLIPIINATVDYVKGRRYENCNFGQ